MMDDKQLKESVKEKDLKITELGKKYDIFNIECNLVGINVDRKTLKEKRKILYKFGSKITTEVLTVSAMDFFKFAFEQMLYDLKSKLKEFKLFE